MRNAIRPPALKVGDDIRIVTPASATDIRDLSKGISALKNLGYKISLGKNIRRLAQRGDLAAPDKDRAEELMDAFKDNSVKAIFCARGGYGSIRILPYLDFDLIKLHPKIFVGYSDITALHLAINKMTDLITFHGPMPGVDADEIKKPSFKQFMSVLSGESTDISGYINRVIKYAVPGKTEGVSAGTCMSVFASLIGTEYITEPEGKILFMEDTGSTAADIDRYMFRLKLSKMLKKFNGFAFGDFTDIPTIDEPMPAIEEVIEGYMEELSKPSIFGLPFGHSNDQMLIPLNAKVRISSEEPYLELLEKVVD
ncbi:MAG: LD-carboxypeptidase [Candidatus Parvarchaeota archaeon]|nr:LD-carboxypeptidase [Candidatus Parvarchaeota archaeon]